MTTKAEEVRAQSLAIMFLRGIANGEIKRIPADVREHARLLLRHLASAETVERGSRL